MFQDLYWQDLFHLPVCLDETPLAPDVVTKCRVLDVIAIEAGRMAVYAFELSAGDTLSVTIAASDPVELTICPFHAYEAWLDGQDLCVSLKFLEGAPLATLHRVASAVLKSQEMAVIVTNPVTTESVDVLFEATVR